MASLPTHAQEGALVAGDATFWDKTGWRSWAKGRGPVVRVAAGFQPWNKTEWPCFCAG